MIPCDRSEKRNLPVHFRMALVLTSEMVSQVIISIFRRSLGKLKWKFRSHAERWRTNHASMAMRKSSSKNTPQYLRSRCSPIEQNNTKDFSAQSGGSIGRAVWKWSGKSRFPRAFSALLINLRRFISLPELIAFGSLRMIWLECRTGIAWFESKRFDWPSVSFFDPWPIRMLGLLPLFGLN